MLTDVGMVGKGIKLKPFYIKQISYINRGMLEPVFVHFIFIGTDSLVPNINYRLGAGEVAQQARAPAAKPDSSASSLESIWLKERMDSDVVL